LISWTCVKGVGATVGNLFDVTDTELRFYISGQLYPFYKATTSDTCAGQVRSLVTPARTFDQFIVVQLWLLNKLASDNKLGEYHIQPTESGNYTLTFSAGSQYKYQVNYRVDH
jgi:hypothetical protein